MAKKNKNFDCPQIDNHLDEIQNATHKCSQKLEEIAQNMSPEDIKTVLKLKQDIQQKKETIIHIINLVKHIRTVLEGKCLEHNSELKEYYDTIQRELDKQLEAIETFLSQKENTKKFNAKLLCTHIKKSLLKAFIVVEPAFKQEFSNHQFAMKQQQEEEQLQKEIVAEEQLEQQITKEKNMSFGDVLGSVKNQCLEEDYHLFLQFFDNPSCIRNLSTITMKGVPQQLTEFGKDEPLCRSLFQHLIEQLGCEIEGKIESILSNNQNPADGYHPEFFKILNFLENLKNSFPHSLYGEIFSFLNERGKDTISFYNHLSEVRVAVNHKILSDDEIRSIFNRIIKLQNLGSKKIKFNEQLFQDIKNLKQVIPHLEPYDLKKAHMSQKFYNHIYGANFDSFKAILVDHNIIDPAKSNISIEDIVSTHANTIKDIVREYTHYYLNQTDLGSAINRLQENNKLPNNKTPLEILDEYSAKALHELFDTDYQLYLYASECINLKEDLLLLEKYRDIYKQYQQKKHSKYFRDMDFQDFWVYDRLPFGICYSQRSEIAELLDEVLIPPMHFEKVTNDMHIEYQIQQPELADSPERILPADKILLEIQVTFTLPTGESFCVDFDFTRQKGLVLRSNYTRLYITEIAEIINGDPDAYRLQALGFIEEIHNMLFGIIEDQKIQQEKVSLEIAESRKHKEKVPEIIKQNEYAHWRPIKGTPLYAVQTNADFAKEHNITPLSREKSLEALRNWNIPENLLGENELIFDATRAQKKMLEVQEMSNIQTEIFEQAGDNKIQTDCDLSSVQKFIDSLEPRTQGRLMKKLASLERNPFDAADNKKLKGYQNLYRARMGQIRIIYSFQDHNIQIVDIDYRGNIYKS